MTADLHEQPLAALLTDAQSGFASGEDLDDGIFQIRMNNVTRQGRLDLSRKRRVPIPKQGAAKFLLERGDVLYNATNSPEMVGKSTYFPGLDEPVVFSNHFIRLRANPAVLDGRYLARWLQLQFVRRVFENGCRRWVNQATFDKTSLLRLMIPTPTVSEQHRIADILDKADEVIANRMAALTNLDSLVVAHFVEMFGDPTKPSSPFPMMTLGSIGSVTTGNTPSRLRSEFFGNDMEWIKSDNIQPPNPFLERSREGLSHEGVKVGRVAPAGSILVTCIAGTPASIGNAAIADRAVAFNQQINALTPNEGPPSYFHTLLVAGKSVVQAASTASMKGMISKSKFSEIRLPIAPIYLQNKFAEVAQSVYAQRERSQDSAHQLDGLFTSIQQRAFQGVL